MKKFVMEQPFLDIFPDSKIGILVCKGIDNHIKEEDKYDKLAKLKKLLDDNVITQEEFEKEKAKLLQ